MNSFVKKVSLASLALGGLLLAACGDDDASDNGGGGGTPLSVSTPVVSAVTSSSAVVSATATGSAITSRGVCYGTSANPTINDMKVTGTSKDMNITLAGLKASTTYHVRAYVQSSNEVKYSDDVTFTTAAETTSDLDKPRPAAAQYKLL